ncbi:MAG TPA: hypothetical protein DDX39_00665 [Bacteroidales bacterium]|nr:MAG: hypothetical protein A2W98_08215 [Bacteroidetes bacterium GWF2_33_38]OFY69867.1 MAG: hypothetical protein A2265_08995 [Bacteroidetes bacterium RIFOXYA12_FULL_33_9]HBF87123.1 hypothetical protein [Bacteroidales bacterium]
MKHIIFIPILLILFRTSFACSCTSGQSFCFTHSNYNLTTSCVVIDTFPNGISLKILHILRGIENRDTIKVWDLGGPYNVCTLTDSRASFLGSIGDTLIISLPRIDTIKNTWDVIGDYRTPGFECDTYILRVQNNTVIGFISGSPYCYYLQNCVNNYDYNDFIVDFPSKSLSCETWLNSDDLNVQEFLNYYPNPTIDKFIFTSNEKGTLTISNSLGQITDILNIKQEQTIIPTDNLMSGIYFLTFKTDSYNITEKFIVQH